MRIGNAEGQHPPVLAEYDSAGLAMSAVQRDPALCGSIPHFACFDFIAHRPNRLAVDRVGRIVIQQRYPDVGEREAGRHAK